MFTATWMDEVVVVLCRLGYYTWHFLCGSYSQWFSTCHISVPLNHSSRVGPSHLHWLFQTLPLRCLTRLPPLGARVCSCRALSAQESPARAAGAPCPPRLARRGGLGAWVPSWTGPHREAGQETGGKGAAPERGDLESRGDREWARAAAPDSGQWLRGSVAASRWPCRHGGESWRTPSGRARCEPGAPAADALVRPEVQGGRRAEVPAGRPCLTPGVAPGGPQAAGLWGAPFSLIHNLQCVLVCSSECNKEKV